MSSNSSSTSCKSSMLLSSRSRSSSWIRLVLFTILIYILLLSTSCCEAVPVWKSGSQMKPADVASGEVSDGIGALTHRLSEADEAVAAALAAGEFDSPDSILRLCLSNDRVEERVFVKTLCSLAFAQDSANTRTNTHARFVKRASDRSAFSTFNRMVHVLRQHANEVSDYQDRLNRLQELGFLDHNYNVISVPHGKKKLMQQYG